MMYKIIIINILKIDEKIEFIRESECRRRIERDSRDEN